jgi:hypothetical protein
VLLRVFANTKESQRTGITQLSFSGQALRMRACVLGCQNLVTSVTFLSLPVVQAAAHHNGLSKPSPEELS